MACRKSLSSLKTETGAQLFARLESRPSLDSLESSLFSTLAPGTAVEVAGDAGSGKSELLYHFIARCIFPTTWKSIPLNGLDVAVIFIDNDYKFDIFRLIKILEKRINTFQAEARETELSSDEVSSFVIECLRLLYVVKCSSTENFLITLFSLENIIASNNKIACMMIDSISNFYWIDRMNCAHQNKKLEDEYAKLVSVLDKLAQNYSLVIFATRQNLIKKKDSHANVDYQFLGRQWQKFVMHRLELSFESGDDRNSVFILNHMFKSGKTVNKFSVSDSGVMFM